MYKKDFMEILAFNHRGLKQIFYFFVELYFNIPIFFTSPEPFSLYYQKAGCFLVLKVLTNSRHISMVKRPKSVTI